MDFANPADSQCSGPLFALFHEAMTDNPRQTGRIVDGLQWFKKNISSHFEGQEECAICYSLVHNFCWDSLETQTALQVYQRHGSVPTQQAMQNVQEQVPCKLPLQG
jgi:hypothetical protein